GVATPTVIIPTSSGTTVSELFRFNGVGREHERTENLCVYGGFACGISPRLSSAFTGSRDCRRSNTAGEWSMHFINSAACVRGTPPRPVPGPHFYLAFIVVD